MDTIGLTFEAGPDATWTPQILAALEECESTATFFVVASRAVQQCRLTAQVRLAGHAIALGCDELPQGQRTRTELALDTDRGLSRLHALGVSARLWRPSEGARAPIVERLARERGLTAVDWTIDSHDWRGDTAEEMLARISPELRDGAVIRVHDGLGPRANRAGCAQTVQLVRLLAKRARALGLTLAALEDDGQVGATPRRTSSPSPSAVASSSPR